MPTVQVYKLDTSRYLITYAQTMCNGGICHRWLKGYLLQPDAMTGIFETRIGGSNARQYADCQRRLGDAAAIVTELHENQPPTQAQEADLDKVAAHECYAIDGEVHLISRGGTESADVQLRYTGTVSEASGKQRGIAQTRLFRLEGDKLVQIEGEANPVPAQDAQS